MLTIYFRRPAAVTMLRRALGDVGDKLAAQLHDRGYSRKTVQRYIWTAHHFVHWTRAEARTVKAPTDAVVIAFLKQHLRRCKCPFPFGTPVKFAGAALKHMFALLRRLGRLVRAQIVHRDPMARVLNDLGKYLRDVRGSCASTSRARVREAKRFLEFVHGSSPINLTKISQNDVVRFVVHRAEHLKSSSLKDATKGLRALFGFLQFKGICDARLVHAVPTVPNWRLAEIPKVLEKAQTKALLRAFDLRTATGKRDYAMTLCMLMLGLRAHEVACLSLEHIDWKRGTIRIEKSKNRTATLVPLPRDVGDAIARYLRRGRPPTRERRVFVRHLTPSGLPVDGFVVRAAIRRAFDRCGVPVPNKGTHVLRHTVATRLIRAGATLKEIADTLRHRSLESVFIYSKVDMRQLAAVALPWPGTRA